MFVTAAKPNLHLNHKRYYSQDVLFRTVCVRVVFLWKPEDAFFWDVLLCCVCVCVCVVLLFENDVSVCMHESVYVMPLDSVYVIFLFVCSMSGRVCYFSSITKVSCKNWQVKR